MSKDLSIIIISYNTKTLTVECIKSALRYQKKINAEIIVVDNNSNDDSAFAISKMGVKLIKNKTNKGFSGANNQAAKLAAGKYLLFLNSDTLISKDIFSSSIDYLNKNKKIGFYSVGLRNKDGSYQEAGGYFPTLPRVFAWMMFIDDLPILSNIIQSYHPKINFYKVPRRLDWVKGTCMFVRKEAWDGVQGFDEDYFMYVEDIDICYKGKKLGWDAYYDPKNDILHYGGASSTSDFPLTSEISGLRRFYSNYYSTGEQILLRFILKFGSFMRMILFGFLKDPKYFSIYKKVYYVS